MPPSSPRTSPAARAPRLPRWCVALALCLLPSPGLAAVVKPWTPANADSITSLVAEAKVRFRQSDTDTITDRSIAPFERVGQAARRLYRRLGRQNTLFAPSIAASLDSLGLDTEVVNDPELPSIVLVLVRNPYRPSMQAVGYLLWYRGPDLRMQGMAFPPCREPKVRSWWTGRPGGPYATAIVYHERNESGRLGFKYLRLSGDGSYWELIQYEGHGPDLGANGDATFADLDHDGQPELVAFSAAPPDSILRILPPVVPPRREAIYTDRGEGFEVHDARVVPGPITTLRLFVAALREGNRDQARRLLVDPSFLQLALAAGWADTRSPGNFVVDRQEEGQRWPRWLGARVLGVTGERNWVFHFTLQDGLWMIKDWIAEESPQATAARRAAQDSTGGHRP
jgi:hypothetical protein